MLAGRLAEEPERPKEEPMPGPELDDRLDHLLHAVAAGVTAGDPGPTGWW
jgi:hypothetical protein